MKLLYIPHPNSNLPQYDDFYMSFGKHVDTVWFYAFYNEILYGDELYDYDFIYLQSGGISRENLLILKNKYPQAKVCQWTGDCRKHQIDNVMWCYDLCDINYLAAWQPDLYPGMRWLPHGVADWQFRDINPDAKGIVFIGNAQLEFPGGKERYELCLELEKRDDFTWYGSPKKQVDYRDTPDIYNKYKFAIGASIFYDVPMYFSNRTLGALAAGCLVYQRRFKQLNAALIDKSGYLIYDNNEFLLDMINDTFEIDLNEFIGYVEKGQNIIRENFHYDILAKQIINELTQLS